MRLYGSFVSVRRGWAALGLIAILGVLTSFFGLRMASVPSAVEHHGATVPMWRILAMGVGVTPVLSLHSGLRQLEETASRHHRRTESLYAAILSLVGIGGYLLCCSMTLPLSVTLVAARASTAWLGLAILSGRIFGWRFAWIVPAVVSCVLTYWGGGGTHGPYAWLAHRPAPEDGPSLLLSVLLLAIGMVVYTVTPWRWCWLIGRLRDQ
jgi:hypothetical protein